MHGVRFTLDSAPFLVDGEPGREEVDVDGYHSPELRRLRTIPKFRSDSPFQNLGLAFCSQFKNNYVT